jgi:hypothetical protein
MSWCWLKPCMPCSLVFPGESDVHTPLVIFRYNYESFENLVQNELGMPGGLPGLRLTRGRAIQV